MESYIATTVTIQKLIGATQKFNRAKEKGREKSYFHSHSFCRIERIINVS